MSGRLDLAYFALGNLVLAAGRSIGLSLFTSVEAGRKRESYTVALLQCGISDLCLRGILQLVLS